MIWLLKPAELILKGGNRKSFEKQLFQNMQRIFSKIDEKIKIRTTQGRYYLQIAENKEPEPSINKTINNELSGLEKIDLIENALSKLIGISGWARTVTCEKNPDAVLSACAEEGKRLFWNNKKTFKIDARRTDKSFPLSSYELCCKGGEAVLTAAPEMKVDIHNPDDIIRIEIREKAFVYSGGVNGLGGLPVGSAGKGMLLLSGGIDSPVAGFLMACRGMSIDAIHFHAYPYTSLEAKQKVIRLAQITGSFCLGIKLYVLNFTKVQMRIKEKAPYPWTTVLLRMAMMEAAEKAALKIKCKCLITGESLSQVASQTIENLNCTQSRIKLPVLRPLIGFDKHSIIKEARRIGTYDVSIEPFADCCTLFSPPHPVLHGDVKEANSLYESLELNELIDEALNGYEAVG
ncbi:MAG: tRNA 4-thiouridine(8) synthase ThiI [Treponema sp.]|nr:tRNA 4-thiouridine(8) synthase ThiI [Treponema sp.]